MSERGAQSGDGETGACHVCSETFGTQEELAEHLRQQHEQDALGDVRPEPTPEASPQGETS
jgi:C2H2-type zinc finger